MKTSAARVKPLSEHTSLADRMVWARAQMEPKMSQAALAKAVGAVPSTIGNCESGLRGTNKYIALIADVLGVDVLWLSEGKGVPYPHKTKRHPAIPEESILYLTPAETALIKTYREASHAQKGAIETAAAAVDRLKSPTVRKAQQRRCFLREAKRHFVGNGHQQFLLDCVNCQKIRDQLLQCLLVHNCLVKVCWPSVINSTS